MKFAYLIMAHHRFDVLKELLADLDDERNDIFLHIDKKTKKVPIDNLRDCVKKAHLEIIKPRKVYWGHSSQIKCVLSLLKSACESGFHDYYHLLVGVEFPILSQNSIYDFFEDNNGKEFIGFDLNDDQFFNRIKYFYFWGKYARSKNKMQRLLFHVGLKAVDFQKKNGINRISRDKTDYKKGYANWSITDGLARHILSKTAFIKRRMWLTSCADEIFFHTIAYNSAYKSNIYDLNNEYHSCMRLTTWNNSNNRMSLTDIDDIVNSGLLFVRKVDGDDALDVIHAIKSHRIAIIRNN